MPFLGKQSDQLTQSEPFKKDCSRLTPH